jgi:drug/metabolite transporter (DMT)-like permease
LIIRSIHESPWTILFWRGLLTATSLTVVAAALWRGRVRDAFRAIGWVGLVVAVFQAGGNLSFVTAVTQTSVANVLVIVATAPLFAAVLGWLVLGEAVPLRTWIAIACVVGAVALVVAGSLSSGHALGDIIALGGSLCSAAAITAIRHARAINMIPAMALAATLCAVLALGVGARIPDAPGRGLILLQGLILLPGAIALLTTATRRLPAAEISLISRLELVLGVIWVWAIIGEAPSITAIVSGVAIAATLTVHTWLGIRSESRAR